MRLRDGRDIRMFVRAPRGSPENPFSGEAHEARFTRELSSRVPDKVCAEIVAMSRNWTRSIRAGCAACWPAANSLPADEIAHEFSDTGSAPPLPCGERLEAHYCE